MGGRRRGSHRRSVAEDVDAVLVLVLVLVLLLLLLIILQLGASHLELKPRFADQEIREKES